MALPKPIKQTVRLAGGWDKTFKVTKWIEIEAQVYKGLWACETLRKGHTRRSYRTKHYPTCVSVTHVPSGLQVGELIREDALALIERLIEVFGDTLAGGISQEQAQAVLALRKEVCVRSQELWNKA